MLGRRSVTDAPSIAYLIHVQYISTFFCSRFIVHLHNIHTNSTYTTTIFKFQQKKKKKFDIERERERIKKKTIPVIWSCGFGVWPSRTRRHRCSFDSVNVYAGHGQSIREEVQHVELRDKNEKKKTSSIYIQ